MSVFPAIPAFVLVLLAVIPSALASPKLDRQCNGDAALAKFAGGFPALRQAVGAGQPLAQAAERYAPASLNGGQLQCLIAVTEITPDLLTDCQAAGLTIAGTHSGWGIHHITVRCRDPFALDSIVRRQEVRSIWAEPLRGVRAGSVQNQADRSIRADLARTQYGINGSGVRVGVLSDSVNDTLGGIIDDGILRASRPQASSDLPPQVRVIDPGPGMLTDEGAAMMELIHDLAPGAALSFASAFTGYAQFAANILALRTDPGYGCDVICDDVIYYAEPVYQDGPIALAVEEVVAAGAVYFSSAGNDADNAHERTFHDVNPAQENEHDPPDGTDFHDFGAAYGRSSDTHLELRLPSRSSVIATLHWDEPGGGVMAAGPGAGADLDLYLVRDTNLPLSQQNILSSGNDFQGSPEQPAGEPVETMLYTNTLSNERTVYLVIDHYAGRKPVQLRLGIFLSGGATIVDKHLVRDRTVYGHAAAEHAMACAAIFYGEIDSRGVYQIPSAIINVEPFSSHGGDLPIWFNGQGTLRYTTPQIRYKPDFAAPDGSNTSFFSQDIAYDDDSHPNFFGTSAAAPHAAAVAALLLEASPALSPTRVYQILRQTALDVESPGPDILSGAGLIDAIAAVQRVYTPQVRRASVLFSH